MDTTIGAAAKTGVGPTGAKAATAARSARRATGGGVTGVRAIAAANRFRRYACDG